MVKARTCLDCGTVEMGVDCKGCNGCNGCCKGCCKGCFGCEKCVATWVATCGFRVPALPRPFRTTELGDSGGTVEKTGELVGCAAAGGDVNGGDVNGGGTPMTAWRGEEEEDEDEDRGGGVD